MRKVHRFIAVFALFFALYVGGTGTLLQLIDLKTLLSHAPATDPNMQALREGFSGPPNFQVIVPSDYSAAALPAGFDFEAALPMVMKAARAALDAPIRFVELRMVDGKPLAQVNSAGKLLRFDALSGALITRPDMAAPVTLPVAVGLPSQRNVVKNLHRMTTYGDYATVVFVLIALALCVMVVTGLAMYFRLLNARARIARSGAFWLAGGWWRTLHRGIAIVAGVFLVIVVFSGTLLGLGDVGVSYFRVAHHGKRPGLTADVSAPLSDAQLPAMLHTTLAAYHAAAPGAPLKVLRLRYFAGMPQGVIVAGADEDTQQIAFNATTGDRASLSGPGYPVTGQPFGWQEDQIVKHIHRGDVIGLSGRWISLFTGLSMLFLALSGAVMYFDLWRRRRDSGRRGLFWS